jgi:hypothetical protein
MTPANGLHASTYDDALGALGHFSRYPNLMPWVGQHYHVQDKKILVLGESHYMDVSVLHHDEKAWYAGIDPTLFTDLGWAHTRNLIGKGVDTQWRSKGRGKVMYRHIDDVLCETWKDCHAQLPAFHRIAYMNYFQRPAEKSGESIRVTDLDRVQSAAVLNYVIRILAPHLVIFCSKLAWRAAYKQRVMEPAKHTSVRFAFTAHPTTSWWNRPMKKYGGLRGRDQFFNAVQALGPDLRLSNQFGILTP